MDRLQKAKIEIERAENAGSRENAMLKTQIAIAHAMVALTERVDKMLQLYDDKQNQLEMLAGH